MTLLPEKDLLAGTKTPKTTTGEMKNALGKVRDYLAELFGDDSMDKEKARQTLGIRLVGSFRQIGYRRRPVDESGQGRTGKQGQ